MSSRLMLPYRNTAYITRPVPAAKRAFTGLSKTIEDKTVVSRMDRAVEKFFSMLSAYLMTTAISRPPSALLTMQSQLAYHIQADVIIL